MAEAATLTAKQIERLVAKGHQIEIPDAAPTMSIQRQVMSGVNEYVEGFDVALENLKGRLVVRAINQGGYDCTYVDLLQLITWLKTHRPELLTT
jgi:hypothetical protein